MNELERLSYLDALDIQQWISRAGDMGVKLHAMESEFVGLNHFIVENKAVEKKVVDGDNFIEQVLEVPDVSVAMKQQQPREKAKQDSDSIKDTLVKETVVKENFPRYALLQVSKPKNYFIFADLQDASGKISVAEQQLLNNICQAIHKVLKTDSSTSTPEVFKWPMFESKFKAEHLDQGEQAAIESAQAFVGSRVKSQEAPLLILLGEQAQKLILQIEIISGSDQQIHYLKSAVFANEKIIAAKSLQYMLENTASKAILWHGLCEYFNELSI